MVWRTAQVMRNVAAMLGPGWGMQVFHGDRNCALLKAHFSEEEQARVSWEGLGVDNLSSSQEYSSLLCSLWFWSRVAAETVLVFQAQPVQYSHRKAGKYVPGSQPLRVSAIAGIPAVLVFQAQPVHIAIG